MTRDTTAMGVGGQVEINWRNTNRSASQTFKDKVGQGNGMEEGRTIAHICDECGTPALKENITRTPDGYAKFECDNCGEVNFSEPATERKVLEDDPINEPSSPAQKEKNLQEKQLREREDADVTVVDELTEDGSCCRPGCENDDDVQKMEYDDGRTSGPLCADHRGE